MHQASAPVLLVDPDALFDIQVKRIHEYKRQHLNYSACDYPVQPAKAHDPAARHGAPLLIFGGKAAPGYFMAKLIIKLINSVGGCGEQ